MMNNLLFSVDRVQCAIPLDQVRIVLQMVLLGPAPESRPDLAGTVNFHGQIIPVWSVRSFFKIPERAPLLTDKLIIAQSGHDCIALWVDETHVIQQSPVLPAPVENVEKGENLAEGVARISDGTYIFSDIVRLLGQGTFSLPDGGRGRIDPHRSDSP